MGKWAIASALGLVVLAAFMANVAFGNHYHNNCVNHGFVHGSSTGDNYFWSRIEAGCGNPGSKYCRLIYAYGRVVSTNAVARYQNVTCNAAATPADGAGEYATTSFTDFNGVFSDHGHYGHYGG